MHRIQLLSSIFLSLVMVSCCSSALCKDSELPSVTEGAPNDSTVSSGEINSSPADGTILDLDEYLSDLRKRVKMQEAQPGQPSKEEEGVELRAWDRWGLRLRMSIQKTFSEKCLDRFKRVQVPEKVVLSLVISPQGEIKQIHMTEKSNNPECNFLATESAQGQSGKSACIPFKPLHRSIGGVRIPIALHYPFPPRIKPMIGDFDFPSTNTIKDSQR